MLTIPTTLKKVEGIYQLRNMVSVTKKIDHAKWLGCLIMA
jgi:hypothetical protein